MAQQLGPFPRIKKALYLCTPLKTWRGVRVVEGARLESVYRPKAYRGFESLSLRRVKVLKCTKPCKLNIYTLFAFISDTTQKTIKVGLWPTFIAFNRDKSSFLYPNWVAIW